MADGKNKDSRSVNGADSLDSEFVSPNGDRRIIVSHRFSWAPLAPKLLTHVFFILMALLFMSRSEVASPIVEAIASSPWYSSMALSIFPGFLILLFSVGRMSRIELHEKDGSIYWIRFRHCIDYCYTKGSWNADGATLAMVNTWDTALLDWKLSVEQIRRWHRHTFHTYPSEVEMTMQPNPFAVPKEEATA